MPSALGFVTSPSSGRAAAQVKFQRQHTALAAVGRAADAGAAGEPGRRPALAGALAAAATALTGGAPALAAIKGIKRGDEYSADMGNLDKMMKKDWGQAVEETKCKTYDEGERRSFCVTKEINDENRRRAEARGEKYVDQKATLSKGSYGT